MSLEIVVTFVAGLLCGLMVHEGIIHPTLARRANLRRHAMSASARTPSSR